MSKKRVLIGSIVSIGVLCLVITTVILYIRSTVDPTPWRKETAPLSQEVITDLYEKFSLGSTHSLCSNARPVYADEFFSVIEENLPKDKATFDDVNQKLSKYEWKREPIVEEGDGFRYFRVWYDLKGDKITALVYFFEEQGTVFKISEYLANIDW